MKTLPPCSSEAILGGTRRILGPAGPLPCATWAPELWHRARSNVHGVARTQPVSGSFCFREVLWASRLLQALRARLHEGWTLLLAELRHRPPPGSRRSPRLDAWAPNRWSADMRVTDSSEGSLAGDLKPDQGI